MAKLYYADSTGKPGKKKRFLPTYRWWKRAAIMSWTLLAATLGYMMWVRLNG